MSTPLLCRETAYECAGDLLRKRDALLLLREYISINESYLHLVDAQTGATLRRLS